MNLTLQPSTYAYLLLTKLQRGRIVIGTNGQQGQALSHLFRITHDCNIDQNNTKFDLAFHEIEVDDFTKRATPVIPGFGELPGGMANDNEKHGLPRDAWPLAPGESHKHFGLSGIGFSCHVEIDDLSNGEIRTIIGFDTSRGVQPNHNAMYLGIPGKKEVDTQLTPRENSDVDFALDSRYTIAAINRFDAGHAVPFFDRELEDVRRLTKNDLVDCDEQPMALLNYHIASHRFLPMVDEEILKLTESYYSEGVPAAYTGYERCVPVTPLVARILAERLDDPKVTIKPLVPFLTTKIGEGYSGSFAIDDDGGTTFHFDEQRNTEGKPLRLPDLNYHNPTVSPLVVVDAQSLMVLADYGYEPINILDWFTGATPDDE